MEHEEVRTFLVHSVHDIGIQLTDSQIAQFMCYLSQLSQWNKAINLTSISDPYEVVIKHFVDSLLALAAMDFPKEAVVIDVGSGAGFPGIPLKIARNDLKITLIEPSKKKCSFLASILGLLRLERLAVFQGTVQQYNQKADRPIADIVTVRALNVEDIADSVLKALSPDGKLVLYRTRTLELSELDRRFRIENQRAFCLPRNSGSRVISVLSSSSL